MIRLTPIGFDARKVALPAHGALPYDSISNHLDCLHGDGHWVDLWYLPMQVDEFSLKASEKLRPDEVARANRMLVANARERFILDHAWRNQVMEVYAEGSTAYTLAASRHGKQRLIGAAAPGVSFSRTGSHAVTAIADLADIGVDIEDCRAGRRWLQLAATIDTHGWPAGCESTAERARWVCRQFVVKEALLKGVGIGLRFPLRAIGMHYSAKPLELYQKMTPRPHCRPGRWHVISEMRRCYSVALAIKYPRGRGALTVTEFHCRGGDPSDALEIVSRRLSVDGAAE